MSLDVWLNDTIKTTCQHCGKEGAGLEVYEAFSANITHNLGRMAEEAGLYEIVWRPEENGIEKASQLIAPLEAGIALMKSDPARFEAFNSSNGWGLYKNFVPWLEGYLAACKEYPNTAVHVSR
jgi:hypothetical protein